MVRLLVAALVAVAAVFAVFLVGMRRKSPAVQDAVRRFNRSFTNPRVMKSAGTAGASASVIEHVGRTSRRIYQTPIQPFPTADGWLIALPYGTQADWLKNVLAAGSAVLLHDGERLDVVRPEVVPTDEIIAELPSSEQRTLRWFRVEHCLRIHRADESVPAEG